MAIKPVSVSVMYNNHARINFFLFSSHRSPGDRENLSGIWDCSQVLHAEASKVAQIWITTPEFIIYTKLHRGKLLLL